MDIGKTDKRDMGIRETDSREIKNTMRDRKDRSETEEKQIKGT